MINLDGYLSYIQEQRGRKQELGKGGVKKKPSPSFAYELVHKKSVPDGFRSGRYPGSHRTKKWNRIDVDAHLKDKWLTDLSKIPNVEIRGSCEGHGADWPSYISFRVNPKHDKDKTFLNKVIKELNKSKDTRCGWDVGTQNRPRFVCATPLFYGCKKQNEWVKWWNNIASRINSAVNS